MAAEPEYGPALRARIRPLITGVGPVEAAAGVAHALALLQAESALPDLIVSLGSAGSRTLDHARVYRVASVSYRDMDASALGFPKGETPYPRLPAVLPLADGPTALPIARLATGASVVSGTAYDVVDADMVDMETFAVLRACHGFDVPLIALRGISDGDQELGGLHDWTEHLHVVDENLAAAVKSLMTAMERGGLAALR